MKFYYVYGDVSNWELYWDAAVYLIGGLLLLKIWPRKVRP